MRSRSCQCLFQLTKDEVAAFEVAICDLKGAWRRRYAPYVFTEQGVAMLSGVLRSETAVAVNIANVREVRQA